MNTRPSILLGSVALLAALGVAVFWISQRSHKTANIPPPDNESPAEPTPASVQTAAGNVPQPLGKDVPIMFYGRLEDQSAEPVAEADIIGTTVFHHGEEKASARFSTRTDADGLFQLSAGVGESLELLPRKPGYALAATNTIAFYGSSKPDAERHHPDPNRPVMIKMWKLQGAEPLATLDGRYRVNPANGPVYFDFVTQTFDPTNGDIRITINRPSGVISPSERPDWSVELEGVYGGLMEVTAQEWGRTYWAPTDGYRSRQVLLMSTNAPGQWSQNADALYFVQTRDGGVYTKLSLKVAINLNPKDPVDLVLYGFSNTNGSCNWEGDPGTLNQQ